jgi:hypothetical protein
VQSQPQWPASGKIRTDFILSTRLHGRVLFFVLLQTGTSG